MRALHDRSFGLLVSAILLLSVGAASAKDFPPRPTQYVYDEADWLSGNEELRLAARLAQFERESSNQILVAILRSLDDEDLADYSQQLAEHWGIGQKGHDNGVLMVFYANDRRLSIEVGYGLEAVVTDAIAARIRDEILVPGLRGGDRAASLNAGVTAVMAASRGEFQGSGRANADGSRRSKSRGFPIWIIWLIMAMLFGGGGRRGRRSWVGPVLYGAMLGSSGRRGGGGFGGGGFGGGGFGGGGGSFGGGGARGGW